MSVAGVRAAACNSQENDMSNNKAIIHTSAAPDAIGLARVRST